MILVTLDMQIHMHQRANWKVKTHVEWHLITLIDGELMDLVTCRGKWSPYILYNAHTGCTRTCTYIYIQVYVLLRIWNIWQYDLLLETVIDPTENTFKKPKCGENYLELRIPAFFCSLTSSCDELCNHIFSKSRFWVTH